MLKKFLSALLIASLLLQNSTLILVAYAEEEVTPTPIAVETSPTPVAEDTTPTPEQLPSPTETSQPEPTPTLVEEEPVVTPTPVLEPSETIDPTPVITIPSTETASPVVSQEAQDTSSSTVTPPQQSVPTVTSTSVVASIPEWQQNVDGSFTTSEPVVSGREYHAPFNDKLVIRFSSLPTLAGTVTMKTVPASYNLTIGQQVGAAYEITSTMQDGTFTYNLTLPLAIDNNGYIEGTTVQSEKATVLYSEDGNSFSTASNEKIVSTQNDTVTLRNVDHFTVFVTAATGGVNISTANAADGSSAAYTTLGDIVITEGATTDFADTASAYKTLILTAPTGWQFKSGTGSVSATSGKDIKTSPAGSAPTIAVTTSTITVSIIVSGTTKTDALTISGIQVQATNTTSASGNILRTSGNPGTATITGITNGSTTFGSLSQIAPDTSAPTTPGTPSTTTPTIDTTPTWTWTGSTDNVGVDHYIFYWDTVAGGETNNSGNLSAATTSFTHSTPQKLSTDGTWYGKVKAFDAAGNVTSSNNGSVVLDTTNPTGSFSINSGATYGTTAVTLNFSGVSSDVILLEVRNGTSGSFQSPVTYTNPYSYTLPSGDGTKTVTVRFTDGAGNQSTGVISDSIILETTAPTAVTTSDAGSVTFNPHLSFTWPSASDANGISYYQFWLSTTASETTSLDLDLGSANNWKNIGNVTSYTLTDTEAASLSAETTYFAQVRAVDVAGNVAINASNNWSDGMKFSTTISPSDLGTLLTGGVFSIPSGQTSSLTTSLTATEPITINVTASTGGISTVTIPSGGVITKTDGTEMDATTLTSIDTSVTSLSNLGTGVTAVGALQWGIPNVGLTFSTPITISIFVGTSYNGQTLQVIRSVDGIAWTSDGIVAPRSCVVASGLCTFQATKASYYAATQSVAVFTSTTSGGGTGGASTPSCNDAKPGSAPVLLSVVPNGDNQVTLTWSPASGSVSYYLVAYGTQPGSLRYGNPNVGNGTTFTVSGLSGGQTYYFSVRAGNGCTPGDYSNEVSVTPVGAVITGTANGFAEGVLGAKDTKDTSKVALLPKHTSGSVQGEKNVNFFAWIGMSIQSLISSIFSLFHKE